MSCLTVSTWHFKKKKTRQYLPDESRLVMQLIENLNHQTSLQSYISFQLHFSCPFKNFQIKLFFMIFYSVSAGLVIQPTIDNMKILVWILNYLIYDINTTTTTSTTKIIFFLQLFNSVL